MARSAKWQPREKVYSDGTKRWILNIPARSNGGHRARWTFETLEEARAFAEAHRASVNTVPILRERRAKLGAIRRSSSGRFVLDVSARIAGSRRRISFKTRNEAEQEGRRLADEFQKNEDISNFGRQIEALIPQPEQDLDALVAVYAYSPHCPISFSGDSATYIKDLTAMANRLFGGGVDLLEVAREIERLRNRPVEILNSLQDRASNLLDDLHLAADRGEPKAIYGLYLIAMDATRHLEELAFSSQEKVAAEVRSIARTQYQWPVVASPLHDFQKTHYRSLTAQIDFGAETSILKGLQQARGRPRDFAGGQTRLALEVYNRLERERSREHAKPIMIARAKRRAEQMPPWQQKAQKLPEIHRPKALDKWLRVASQWWNSGGAGFLATIPSVAKHLAGGSRERSEEAKFRSSLEAGFKSLFNNCQDE